jgi:hypothetical protein
MGDPIIIWPPDGTEGCDPEGGNCYGYDPCRAELGWGFYDCSYEYLAQLEDGQIACCLAF